MVSDCSGRSGCRLCGCGGDGVNGWEVGCVAAGGVSGGDLGLSEGVEQSGESMSSGGGAKPVAGSARVETG